MKASKKWSALPEALQAELVAEGESASTGAKRKIFKNMEYGITLTVTWADPYPYIGMQQFTCTHLPGHFFTNYEALRKAWAQNVAGVEAP